MDQNYDAQDFLSYMESLKEDGGNIDSWTTKELEKVVQNYIK